MTDKVKIDYATAVSIALSGTSGTAALPVVPNVGGNLFAVSCSATCRFRISPAAQATAVATDPMITPNAPVLIVRADGADTNISAILDASAGTPTSPSLSICRVFEA
jgi:hypothetical protein